MPLTSVHLITFEIFVFGVILVVDAVVFAEMAEVMLGSQVLHEFVIVEISLVTKLAKRMTAM